MTEFVAHLSAGALLGLAGGLHCACMCGGLTSAALNLFSVRSQKQGFITLAIILLGRILSYAALGAVVAGGARLASDLMAVPAPSTIMPLLGAIALMWIGFSTAGLLPAFSGLSVDTGGSPSSNGWLHTHLETFRRKFPTTAPFAIGLSWGFAPCPLLYAALFLAMLTGSVLGGAMWMIGFGLGTLPPVLMSALGLRYMSSLNLRPHAKTVIGLAIAGFGFATVYFDLGLFEGLCRTL